MGRKCRRRGGEVGRAGEREQVGGKGGVSGSWSVSLFLVAGFTHKSVWICSFRCSSSSSRWMMMMQQSSLLLTGESVRVGPARFGSVRLGSGRVGSGKRNEARVDTEGPYQISMFCISVTSSSLSSSMGGSRGGYRGRPRGTSRCVPTGRSWGVPMGRHIGVPVGRSRCAQRWVQGQTREKIWGKTHWSVQ